MLDSKLQLENGAIAVIQDGEISTSLASESNFEFEIGSLTKLFTAELIAEHIRRGNLTLETTIDDFFYMPPNSYIPTIKDLLSHFSGYEKDYFELFPLIRCLLGFDKYLINTKSVVCSRLRSEKLKAPRYLYSNFGYAILGLVLEQLESKNYKDILLTYCRRIGMEHTNINTQSNKHLWDWDDRDCFIAAGGMTSTINDMAKFALMLSQQNCNLHTCDKLMNLEQPHDLGVGMSWKIRKDGTAYHTGRTANFNSYMSINKALRKSVVVLLNTRIEGGQIAEGIGRQLL